jgi:nucleotide-binding universal stress UspA family protein
MLLPWRGPPKARLAAVSAGLASDVLRGCEGCTLAQLPWMSISNIEVAEGIVPDQIVAAAERIGADTIVMGHRYRSLLKRMAEGSVAKRVIDRARCCVLVAP